MDVPFLIGDQNGASSTAYHPPKEDLLNVHPFEEGQHTIKFKPGIKKRNYDNQKIQDSWAVKLPWAKLCVRLDGSLHIVKCKICSEVEGKNKVFFAN
jgi:hypothetical protein